MRVAEAVAQILKAYETECFFLMTGGDQALWVALEDAGIRMILCRSEQGAAYMADGYARVSGKPGFVYGQSGPGVANVIGGLADAYWAMSPVISLTSATPAALKDRYAYQDLDQLALHSAVTHWNKALTQPEQAPRMVRDAIRVATSSPPGPVHLEIGRNLFQTKLDQVDIYREPAFGKVPSLRVGFSVEMASLLVDRLLQAERPVMIAGSGVMVSGAWEEVQRVAEIFSLPVATSMGGKGAIREDHELALGVMGRYSRKVANDVVRECDLALVVGSRLGALTTNSYTVPPLSVQILHIDAVGSVLGTTYREAISVQADAKLALAAIAEEAVRRGVRRERSPWARRATERVQAWHRRVNDIISVGGERPIHPAKVIAALRAALAPTDLVVADTGYMAAWTDALYPVTAAGRHFVRAAGSLGWAFPAALGARLGAPDKRVACVIGDGGIGYHVAELETAVRCQIPILVVVLNNRSLAFEYHEQKYKERRVVTQVNAFSDADYGAVARAFGARGSRITHDRELQQAIRDGLEAGVPTLLDVLVDKEVVAPVTNFEGVVERGV